MCVCLCARVSGSCCVTWICVDLWPSQITFISSPNSKTERALCGSRVRQSCRHEPGHTELSCAARQRHTARGSACCFCTPRYFILQESKGINSIRDRLLGQIASRALRMRFQDLATPLSNPPRVRDGLPCLVTCGIFFRLLLKGCTGAISKVSYMYERPQP